MGRTLPVSGVALRATFHWTQRPPSLELESVSLSWLRRVVAMEVALSPR
jgi:hypothetical protein